MTQNQGRIGSSFEDYLAEQGILEENPRRCGQARSGVAAAPGHGKTAHEQERHGPGDAHEP